MIKSIIRSPHILEPLFAYGEVHLISIFALYMYSANLYTMLIEYVRGLLYGGCVYTFIEYWFHRYLLHVFDIIADSL